jgi:hypothetical protein
VWPAYLVDVTQSKPERILGHQGQIWNLCTWNLLSRPKTFKGHHGKGSRNGAEGRLFGRFSDFIISV